MLLPDSEMMTVSACWLISIGQASYDNIHGLVFYDWEHEERLVTCGFVDNTKRSVPEPCSMPLVVCSIPRRISLVLSLDKGGQCCPDPVRKIKRTSPETRLHILNRRYECSVLFINNFPTYICFWQHRILYRASSVGRRRTDYTRQVVSISLWG